MVFQVVFTLLVVTVMHFKGIFLFILNNKSSQKDLLVVGQ